MPARPGCQRLRAACERGLLLGLAVLILGEDVERPPQVISPPRPAQPRPPAPASPEAVPATPEVPPGPRYPFLGSGPRRLRLRLPWAEEELPPGASEAERVAAVLRRTLADQLARSRVQRGEAHPAWFDLARRAESFFHPDFSLVRDPAVSEVSGAWLAETARRYLLDDPRRLAERGNEAAVAALVELRFGPGGEGEARLVESSGFRLLDEHALASARDALEHPRGDEAPPAPSRSLLAFRVGYTILPPIPVLGLAFDECTGFVDLIHPLKKIVSSSVIVVAVYTPDLEAPAVAAERPAPPPDR